MPIRRATPADVRAMVELMFLEPSRDLSYLLGTGSRARRFQAATFEQLLAAGAAFVAGDGDGGDGDGTPDGAVGALVGFAVTSGGGDGPPAGGLVTTALRTLGLRGALRAAWRARVRAPVDLHPPEGGRHLVELQVHPGRRGRGLGGRLLDAVEADARAEGAPHLSLTTAIDNPARRLYERRGFSLADTRTDARYEHATGSPGRVLMVKPLTPPA